MLTNQAENMHIASAIGSNITMPLFMEQQRFLAEYLGGFFPEQIDLLAVERVLDVACGPGGWVLDMAHVHRDIEIVGLDSDPQMIQYARAQARSQQVDNALFTTGDMRSMPEIDNGIFQFVQARFIADWISPLQRALVLKELGRVCSPGGTVLWVEGDLPRTNCSAFQQWQQLTKQAITLLGQTAGLTPGMEALFSASGFVKIQRKTATIDFSAHMPAHTEMYCAADVLSRCIRSTLVLSGVASLEEIEQTRQQMLLAMLMDDFCASLSIAMVWGQTPL